MQSEFFAVEVLRSTLMLFVIAVGACTSPSDHFVSDEVDTVQWGRPSQDVDAGGMEGVADTAGVREMDSAVSDSEVSALNDIGVDAARISDTGEPIDTGGTNADSEVSGAGVSVSPFGVIQGECEELLPEINDLNPSAFTQTFVFSGEPFDASSLSSGAAAMFFEENAGGSSKCSEIFSYEVVSRCLDATLYKTETEIVYEDVGALTDYAVTLVSNQRLGVSVTRAYKGPILEYSLSDALELLEKKLSGINEATANVSPSDAWVKQVLHVWTLQPEWAGLVLDAWDVLAPEYLTDTIVLVTVEAGSEYVTTNTCED